MYPFRYSPPPYTVRMTEEFRGWLDNLPDRRGQARILARLQLAEEGNLGDCVSVGERVSEMRIHFGPGYRLYFTRQARVFIVLVAGGDKSTQSRDIERARRFVTQMGNEP